jgi:hypothetical protein
MGCWNATCGLTQTGEQSRTTEETTASTLELKVNNASGVAESVTRILAL